eukprot:TRINITY_DN2379_c0_g1_i4.p1 TRINITY_DN2379_c0_g1~~TRINITY_DN2379_c0_g1_i4.p1  ORF type:complete len:447 (+),score=94.83 TRINITY_DN2379_c0_g1_i4:150-1343(+)
MAPYPHPQHQPPEQNFQQQQLQLPVMAPYPHPQQHQPPEQNFQQQQLQPPVMAPYPHPQHQQLEQNFQQQQLQPPVMAPYPHPQQYGESSHDRHISQGPAAGVWLQMPAEQHSSPPWQQNSGGFNDAQPLHGAGYGEAQHRHASQGPADLWLQMPAEQQRSLPWHQNPRGFNDAQPVHGAGQQARSQQAASSSSRQAAADKAKEKAARTLWSSSSSVSMDPDNWLRRGTSSSTHRRELPVERSLPSPLEVPRELLDGATTVVIKNMPEQYTQELLLQAWPPDGSYNFLLLPFSRQRMRNLGFAFVNFRTSQEAVAFFLKWQGRILDKPRALNAKQKVVPLDIAAANVQGFAANVRCVKEKLGTKRIPANCLPFVFDGTSRVDARVCFPDNVLEVLPG